MTTPTSYIYGARADASDARSESRPDFEHGGVYGGHQPGLIKVVQATGVYQVGIIADGDGNSDTVIDGVRAFPAADLSVGDEVWLVWSPGNPKPVIQVSGGSGGCMKAVTDWGILYG